MKAFAAILLSFFVISVSASFAGTFFEQKPPKEPPKKPSEEKTQQAAAELCESFSYFYMMLANIERNNIGSANEYKDNFLKYLGNSSELFSQAANDMTGKTIIFQPKTKEQTEAWNRLNQEYFHGNPITDKQLAELAIDRTKYLFAIFKDFQIDPSQTDFFPKLRILILNSLSVQWDGISVSDVWEASTTQQ